MLDPTVMEYALRLREMEEERNAWIRLFNRLDAAVSKHGRKGDLVEGFHFADDADEALWAAHERVLKAGMEHEAHPVRVRLAPDSMGP